MNKLCGIYKITSPSSKIYIGQSINIHKRILKYKNLECYEQPKLYNSLLKYGWDCHSFEIIKLCASDDLNFYEKHYIKHYNTFNTEHGMNLSDGGHTTKFTMESIKKISDSKLGIKRPISVRNKISVQKKGKKPHINCIHRPFNYKIYNNENQLIAEGIFNIKNKLNELNLPTYSFCKSYRNHTKINKGKYVGWYVIKL